MTADELITLGNDFREKRQPEKALSCYAQAFAQDFNCVSAWNNYGNVIREMGYPDRAIPFLEQALRIAPNHSTARFNLAVSYLLMGDYQRGWDAYESRWNFEHLDGQLPTLANRWEGQDINGKKILVIGEQGLGDTIQFVRFAIDLHMRGAHITLMVPRTLVTTFGSNEIIKKTLSLTDTIPEYDYWTPIMSIPRFIGLDLKTINSPLQYITAYPEGIAHWSKLLGPKKKLRVGISWSGRRDTWMNQHKSVPFEIIAELISKNPQHEWTNLQIDVSGDEIKKLENIGVRMFPGAISCMSDSAALIANMDVIVSVDTAVSHLAGAMGRPTWVMLNHYAVDWRWLLNRNDSPWYPSARLFRQPSLDKWEPVIKQIARHLDLFKP